MLFSDSPQPCRSQLPFGSVRQRCRTTRPSGADRGKWRAQKGGYRDSDDSIEGSRKRPGPMQRTSVLATSAGRRFTRSFGGGRRPLRRRLSRPYREVPHASSGLRVVERALRPKQGSGFLGKLWDARAIPQPPADWAWGTKYAGAPARACTVAREGEPSVHSPARHDPQRSCGRCRDRGTDRRSFPFLGRHSRGDLHHSGCDCEDGLHPVQASGPELALMFAQQGNGFIQNLKEAHRVRLHLERERSRDSLFAVLAPCGPCCVSRRSISALMASQRSERYWKASATLRSRVHTLSARERRPRLRCSASAWQESSTPRGHPLPRLRDHAASRPLR